MAANSLRDSYDDLRLLDGARTSGRLADALGTILGEYGVEWSAAALFPASLPTFCSSSVQRRSVLLDRWPRDWLEEYVSRNYFRIDPVFRRGRGPYNAVRWSEAFASGCTRSELAIMNGARACGMSDGFTFMFPMPDGATAVISTGGARIDCPDAALGRMALVAQYAVARAICLAGAHEQAPALTARETDVLRWTCEGKTEWEIGEILAVSEHAVDKHLRSLRRKLNACSKTHLVARAFRLGLV